MTKSIREHFQQTGPYHVICREERNLCALLYHLLLSHQDNLPIFLEAIGRDPKTIKDPEIYVEYAHLRDCWYALAATNCSSMTREEKKVEEEKRNKIRREFILDALKLQSRANLMNCTVGEFNSFFISDSPKPDTEPKRRVSETHIESPSNWSIRALNGKFGSSKAENDIFEQIVHFKWCFNVKPDIVIFLSQNQAISIEAKLESKESKYPSSQAESRIFQDRGLDKVAQTEIQKQAFKILRIEADHVILSKHGREDNGFAWKDVFAKLIVKQESKFVQQQTNSFLHRC